MAAQGLRTGPRHRDPRRLHHRLAAAGLERTLQDILDTPTSCELARAVQNKFRRAKDQLLTFALWPGLVEPTNNACERDLRPAVVQRKVTNGYRAMLAAQGEADIRTVIDTGRLKPGVNRFQTILGVVTA